MVLPGKMYVGFQWTQKMWWKFIKPIEYKVYTEHIILASLINKRYRYKDQMTVMRKEKSFTLAVDWEDCNHFPVGLILKLFAVCWGDIKFPPT